jgi:hypothetical protein
MLNPDELEAQTIARAQQLFAAQPEQPSCQRCGAERPNDAGQPLCHTCRLTFVFKNPFVLAIITETIYPTELSPLAASFVFFLRQAPGRDYVLRAFRVQGVKSIDIAQVDFDRLIENWLLPMPPGIQRTNEET